MTRHQAGQLQQVLHARKGSSARLLHKRILGTQIRPARREKGPACGFGKVINPPLPPWPPLLQHLETPTAPGVKRMGYREISRGLPLTGCSPRATPNRSVIAGFAAAGLFGVKCRGIICFRDDRPRGPMSTPRSLQLLQAHRHETHRTKENPRSLWWGRQTGFL